MDPKPNLFKRMVSSAVRGVKKIDMYGVPVGLNLDGEEKFKTFIGGFVSLIFAILILAYSAFQLNIVISKSNNSITTTELYRELEREYNLVDVGKLNFVLGMSIITNKYDKSIIMDETYFSLKYNTVNITKDVLGGRPASVETNQIDIVNWTYQYDGIVRKDVMDAVGITSFLCPDTQVYELGGSGIFTQYSFVYISLDKWSGNAYCKTDAEIQDVIEDIQIKVTLFSFYFNIDSYDDPLQVTVDLNNEINLLYNMKQKVTYSVQINEAQTFDSVFTDYITQTYEYISIGDIFTSFDTISGSKLLEIYVVQSPKYMKVERRVYMIMDMIGQIGGVLGLLIPLGAVIINILSNKIYIMILLSLFYKVEEETNYNKVSPTINTQIGVHQERSFNFTRGIQEESKHNSIHGNLSAYGHSHENELETALKNRQTYIFSWKNLCYMLLWCPKLKCFKRKTSLDRNYKIYKIGEEKIMREMDLKEILEGTRLAKVLSKLILNESQRTLIHYRRDMVLRSERSEPDI